MCRRKGRVVLVGDVGLNLNRTDFYTKELDFFISTSYGPGRYDALYEEQGLEYPAAYVRWTENRNMAEFLRLAAEGKVNVRALIEAVYPVDRAAEAYELLKKGDDRPLMVLFSYPQREEAPPSAVVRNSYARPGKAGQVRLALVGAGGFAKGTHLPLINASERYHLQSVMSRTGHNATSTARQFGAASATTDYEAVLNDKDVDAVLITTRHNLHTDMAVAALRAGKHVLVEKPLALTREELDAIQAFYAAQPEDAPILLTGFNRRFSPFARRIHEII